MKLEGLELEKYLDAMHKRWDFEENILLAAGWIKTKKKCQNEFTKSEYEIDVWIDPENKDEKDQQTAYARHIERKLKANGWKPITEIRRSGKLEWNKPEEKWCKFQSPVTNRLYNFMEAMDVVEHDWDEEKIWPEFCCRQTIEVNKLIGSNFEGDQLKVWFRIENEKRIFELYE